MKNYYWLIISLLLVIIGLYIYYNEKYLENFYPFATKYIPENIPQNTIPYYPNLDLPPSVIGCGHRRGACMGGTEMPIPNLLPRIDINEQNIAPMNLMVRGFDQGLQQVGTIQKVFGQDNIIYPLFGRLKYRTDNKWEYFVKFGDYGVILPIMPLRNYNELSTNDEVFIQGQKDKYRVIIYDNDIPQYLPYT
jgi:hypothetical protein